MSYHFSKTVHMDFDAAVEKTPAELKARGFGVLTQIDVRQTLKDKLGVDFRPYLILGACNPPFAYQALQAEDKIGTLLPCNVIVQQHANGTVEVGCRSDGLDGVDREPGTLHHRRSRPRPAA
jgi:uncharacterized protein (DUF302 family)